MSRAHGCYFVVSAQPFIGRDAASDMEWVIARQSVQRGKSPSIVCGPKIRAVLPARHFCNKLVSVHVRSFCARFAFLTWADFAAIA